MSLFKHFLDFGYDEGRVFSYNYDLSYIGSLPSGLVHEDTSNTSSLSSLASVLINWDLKSIIGPSPFICPIWLSRQKIFKGCDNLPAIMNTIIPSGEFHLHPSLKSLIVDKPMILADLIGMLITSDSLQELSHVNLEEYANNHSDLRDSGLSLENLYKHLWSRGVQENRLKYLGCSIKSSDTFEHRFYKQLSAIFRNFNQGSSPFVSENDRFLAPITINSLPKVADWSLVLMPPAQFLISSNELADQYYSMYVALKNEKTYVVKESDFTHNDELSSVKERPISFLLDEDLWCGRKIVTTKRVVYSINLGNYDEVPTPPPLEDCSFFLITDAGYIPEDSPWEIIRPTVKQDSIKKLCLWYKTHPHILFPNAEFVTWIDGNVSCTDDSVDLFSAHEIISEIATFSHPDRTCTYEEGKKIIELKLDIKEDVERVSKEMEADGFPPHMGFYETNVLFSRISDATVRSFFDLWWSRIYLGSRRDQMSFVFSSWKLGIDISELDAKRCTKNSRYFYKTEHKHTVSRYV